MFKFDESKLPEVEFRDSWDLEDGTINAVYQAGNWSFEAADESDLEYVEGAIYAWIAWYNFIKRPQK